MTAIIAAIIGLIGVILGALIQAFAPQIRSIFFSHKDAPIFTGMWSCHWEITDPPDHTYLSPIEDVVEITKVVGNNIIGKATGPIHGSYVLEGRISPFSVTLLYYGVGTTINQNGVILLKRSDLSDEMYGSWYQYLDNRLLIGTASWKKMGT